MCIMEEIYVAIPKLGKRKANMTGVLNIQYTYQPSHLEGLQTGLEV